MWRQQLLKIFVASLYSSLIQCLTPHCDTTLKNVQDDKIVLIISGICLRDNFSPQTYFGPSYTIFISSYYTLPIITFILPSWDWAIGSQAQFIQFQQYFLDNRPPHLTSLPNFSIFSHKKKRLFIFFFNLIPCKL